MRDRLEKLWVRTRLSLPTPLLRAMSGGAAVVREGRSLDPRLQYLSHVSGGTPGAGFTPEEARRRDARQTALMSPPLEPGVSTETLSMPGPGGGLALRLYEPAVQEPGHGVILYAHGGGGVIGDLDSGAAFCAILASLGKAPVVSVGYRLAPEHYFPAAFEDVLAAFHWLRESGARFGAAPEKVAVAGASIGGGFAASLCQEMRTRGEAQPSLQILLYPLLDFGDEALRNPASFETAWPLSLAGMAWSRDHYLSPQTDAADPRLSPGRAANLAGLAPAVIATGGFDPLRGQAEAYAVGLKAAGVATDYRLYDGLTHDFGAFTAATPAADGACREIAALAAKALSSTSKG